MTLFFREREQRRVAKKVEENKTKKRNMKKLTIKEAKKIAPEYVKEIEKTKTKIDYFFTVIDEDKYNTQLYVKVK